MREQTTERMTVKTLTSKLREPYLRYQERNQQHFKCSQGKRDWDRWFTELDKSTEEGRTLRLVFLQDEEIVASVSLSEIIRGPFQSCFIAWEVDQQREGQGYAYEAVLYTIQIAFTELHLHRIEANIMPENQRSQNLAKRIGFQYEGLSKDYLFLDGAWRDHQHWVLLNQE